jgi:hypothetical protein
MPIACASHLLIDAPLFGGPIVVVVGWIWLDGRRRARRQRPKAARGLPHASSEVGGGTL